MRPMISCLSVTVTFQYFYLCYYAKLQSSFTFEKPSISFCLMQFPQEEQNVNCTNSLISQNAQCFTSNFHFKKYIASLTSVLFRYSFLHSLTMSNKQTNKQTQFSKGIRSRLAAQIYFHHINCVIAIAIFSWGSFKDDRE